MRQELGFSLIATGDAALHPDLPSIGKSHAKVRGVALGDSEKKVRKLLGPPLAVEQAKDEMADGPSLRLRYDGLVAYLVDDEICELTCADARCATPAGVRVGSTWEHVVKTYGPAEELRREAQKLLRYNIRGSDSWMDFVVRGDRVVEIARWLDNS